MTNPTPGPTSGPTAGSEINVILAFIQNLLKNQNIRQDFNPKTPQFWAALGSIAAIVLAWLNPSSDLSTAAQATVTAVGGLVIAVFTHAASTKVAVSKVQKMLAALPATHQSIIAKTVLNPSPAGQIGAIGGYGEGTAGGSVLAPGAVVVVAGPGGASGVTGTGGTTPGATNQGNVSPHVTVNVQSGSWTPGTGAEINLPLGSNVGNNSAEGTGGPAVPLTSGGLGTGGSVESPGGYVAPAPNAPNPDEANPHISVAKATQPHKQAHKKT